MRKQRIRSIVILAAVLLASAGLFVIQRGRAGGDRIVITVDGQAVEELSLNKDSEAFIQTGQDGYNRIIIRRGKAYVAEANCANQICVNSAGIGKDGEVIACLPHKLLITVISSQKEVDGVAY